MVTTISRCMSFWVSCASGRSQPMRSISGASARITAGSAWVSSSVKSIMLSPFLALRVKAAWQLMEQNQRRVRVRVRPVRVEPAEATGAGGADGAEDGARMPEAIRARSIRSLCGRGWDLRDMGHAATRAVGAAFRISPRMARLLKPKVISAEAR